MSFCAAILANLSSSVELSSLLLISSSVLAFEDDEEDEDEEEATPVGDKAPGSLDRLTFHQTLAPERSTAVASTEGAR